MSSSLRKSSEATQAFRELTVQVKKQHAVASEYREKMEKIEADLDRYEIDNQKKSQVILKQKNELIDLNKRLISMEKSFSRLPRSELAAEDTKLKLKEFEFVMRSGTDSKMRDQISMSMARGDKDLQAKYLRTDIDPQGSFLAPPEYHAEIVKKITEISPIRSVARVISTSQMNILIPKRLENVVAQFSGEGQNSNVTQENYGIASIHVDRLTAQIPVTRMLLQDSVFNMESEINADVVEDMARAEGRAFVLGDSVAKPEGLLFNSQIQAYDSQVAGALSPTDLTMITGQLKIGYNPAYMFNRRTLATIRSFIGTNGQFIWTPGLGEREPSTINGEPYILAADMPDIEDDAYPEGSFPVLYGDFRRAYTIVDGLQMEIIRDDFTQAGSGKVIFTFTRRVGGQVLVDEAMKKLHIITD